ncbi:hypothetical protein JOB18_025250 [Solea senegalensis]|uniref:Uncharacterized protein n=1 Tax=Solea senegalensis TaxID=28829 RepID=A0AAV6STS0_SOLSE|nr:hypothetical protein JOB18_025250 [Solea senegalensis]
MSRVSISSIDHSVCTCSEQWYLLLCITTGCIIDAAVEKWKSSVIPTTLQSPPIRNKLEINVSLYARGLNSVPVALKIFQDKRSSSPPSVNKSAISKLIG